MVSLTSIPLKSGSFFHITKLLSLRTIPAQEGFNHTPVWLARKKSSPPLLTTSPSADASGSSASTGMGGHGVEKVMVLHLHRILGERFPWTEPVPNAPLSRQLSFTPSFQATGAPMILDEDTEPLTSPPSPRKVAQPAERA